VKEKKENMEDQDDYNGEKKYGTLGVNVQRRDATKGEGRRIRLGLHSFTWECRKRVVVPHEKKKGPEGNTEGGNANVTAGKKIKGLFNMNYRAERKKEKGTGSTRDSHRKKKR